MAKRAGFAVHVDEGTVRPLKWSRKIQESTYTGVRAMAAEMRITAQKKLVESMYRTEYGMSGMGTAYSLANMIVVSSEVDPITGGSIHTVGAKKISLNMGFGGSLEMSEIFAYMDAGTGKHGMFPAPATARPDGSWIFPLPPSRQKNGIESWVTYGQEPKEFISGTASEYGAKFTAYTRKYVATVLNASLARAAAGGD